jgi:hypothetical protein
MVQTLNLKTFYTAWIEPVVGWLKEMTKGERALLFAVLFLGGVGAYSASSCCTWAAPVSPSSYLGKSGFLAA